MTKILEVTNTDEAYAGACIWEYILETRSASAVPAWAEPMHAVWKEIGAVSMRYSAMSLGPVAHAVWNEMTAAQREDYKGVDEGFDWGFIPAFVRAVVWAGKGYKPFDKRAFIASIAGHVEGAPVVRAHPMAFEYFEVRPCLEFADASGEKQVDSYMTEEDYQEARADLDTNGTPYETFWTVYGRYNDGDGAFIAEAIADRPAKAQAMELLNAILAPMAKARDLAEENEFPIKAGVQISPAEAAANFLADVINQSSDGERL